MSRGIDAHSRVIRRRRRFAAALMALLVAGLAAAVIGRDEPSRARPVAAEPLRVTMGGETVAVLDRDLLKPYSSIDRVTEALRPQMPAFVRTDLARATITSRVDRRATARRALGVSRETESIAAVRRPLTSRIAVPVIGQRLRNNCESAALSALLSAVGRPVSQLRIQAMLPKSGPLDPVGEGPGRVWGDPDRGFVGRPDGGGTAGGFGVYPGPVRAVARELGVPLQDLSGVPAGQIYRRVLQGRPVIAWIGLSDGPYGSWRSPSGRRVRVNFGEHTVVLRGMNGDGWLRVMNPLKGTAETWSRAEFERMWDLLGRRAVGA